jgi:hypothetical protein
LLDDDSENINEHDRKEEAIELEMLRNMWQAARMPRSHLTEHSLFAAAMFNTEEGGDEMITLRLLEHVLLNLPVWVLGIKFILRIII